MLHMYQSHVHKRNSFKKKLRKTPSYLILCHISVAKKMLWWTPNTTTNAVGNIYSWSPICSMEKSLAYFENWLLQDNSCKKPSTWQVPVKCCYSMTPAGISQQPFYRIRLSQNINVYTFQQLHKTSNSLHRSVCIYKRGIMPTFAKDKYINRKSSKLAVSKTTWQKYWNEKINHSSSLYLGPRRAPGKLILVHKLFRVFKWTGWTKFKTYPQGDYWSLVAN